MKNKFIYISLFVISLMTANNASAQSNTTWGLIWSEMHNFEYEINASINIGGSSPMPIPGEIRKINSYKPGLNLSIGAVITKFFGTNSPWGMAISPRLEVKGMDTEAEVKNYGMSIIQDGAIVSGYWTGLVNTKYRQSLFTFPVLGVYKLSPRCRISFGPYFSVAMANDFSGSVYEGYLRETDPTGDKITFEGEDKATYDFSDNLRMIHWGVEAGFSWRAFKHLNVDAHLDWGLSNIFHSSFKTVNFDLYPIYLSVGFGYAF
ncbi:porin family protein [uncultured Muribaculum sp.]|uniref:porin family protein n=1 Tax=uncultured Muribaculum sp. TaxID=1918613 RepID=UPI00258295F8|nr:porin family protein [uncultured Muribaculum sp.]